MTPRLLKCLAGSLTLCACSSPQSAPVPDASSPSDAELASDGPPGACSADGSPDGSPDLTACPVANAACLAPGYDCCVCKNALGCAAPHLWACHTNPPACPAVPPAVGSACTLSNEGCVWCSGGPPTWLGCAGGTWQPLGDFYCTDGG